MSQLFQRCLSIGQQGYVPIAIDVLRACYKYHLLDCVERVQSSADGGTKDSPSLIIHIYITHASNDLAMFARTDAEELSVVRECHQLAVVSADVDLLPCQDRCVKEYILLTLGAYTLHPILYFL
jgi:hypothetical protein